MKLILKDNRRYILCISPDEEVHEEIGKFAKANNIRSAFFWGLGAAKSGIISFYDFDQKKYIDKDIRFGTEIASLTGNIASGENDQNIIHIHGVLTDREMKAYGGHIKKLVISGACEIMLISLDGTMEKKLDKETGLNLMQ